MPLVNVKLAGDAADAHVQIGAMRLACSRIGDWLDETFSTAPAWPAGSGLAMGRARWRG
jgi:hypothetical protein